jgi:hypothetical protein
VPSNADTVGLSTIHRCPTVFPFSHIVIPCKLK